MQYGSSMEGKGRNERVNIQTSTFIDNGTYAISNQRKHAYNYAIKQGKTKARMQKSYHRLCIMYSHLSTVLLNGLFFFFFVYIVEARMRANT